MSDKSYNPNNCCLVVFLLQTYCIFKSLLYAFDKFNVIFYRQNDYRDIKFSDS